MRRRPPRSTRTATLFPYTPLFRSFAALAHAAHLAGDDHGRFRPPAAAFLRRAVVLAGGPQRVELAEVAADQRGQFVAVGVERVAAQVRSEEHTSELQSLMRISYAVFCLKKKT